MKNRITQILLLILMLAPVKGLVPDACAQSWQWGRGATGNGIDAYTVATDASGNAYGAGNCFSNTLVDFGGGVTVPASADAKCVWVKYDNNGTPIWADGTNGGNGSIIGLTTDPAGNLIVFGSFHTATIQIGPFTLTNFYTTGRTDQYFLAKISPAGTVLWAVNDGNVSGTSALIFSTTFYGNGGVATDAAGNIYITSSFLLPVIDIGSFTLTNSDPSALTTDVFVAKYSPAGVAVWATAIGGTDNDNGLGIAVATTGDVYVSGAYASPSFNVGTATLTNTFLHPLAFIARLSGAGVPSWGQGAGGVNGAFACGLVRDNYGSVYMTGGFTDASITFGTTVVNRTYPAAVPQLAMFLVKYSPANVVTWSKTIGSARNGVWGFSITMASCGQVWASGVYSQDADIDGNTLALVTGSDPIFIAGYDLSGTVIGYSGLGSGGDDQNSIACDPKGNVFACADFEGGGVTIGPDVLTAPGGGVEYFYMGKYKNTIAPPDTIYASRDTSVLCTTGFPPVTLRGVPGYTNYYWDDGSSDSTLTVTSAGTYYVYNVTCGATVLVDTIHILSTLDTTTTHHDTTLCASSAPLTLNAPVSYTHYSWSTGSTATSIAVSASGSDIVYCTRGCAILVDTFHTNFLPLPVVNLGNDTTFCLITPLILSSPQPPGSIYAWNTGSAAPSISVTTTGIYGLVVTGANTCMDSAKIRVTISDTPQVDLGPDTAACTGLLPALASIIPYPAGTTYLWSTGSTAATITVGTGGMYWLQVTTNTGCTGTDTVDIGNVYDTVGFHQRDTAICRGASLVVIAKGTPGMKYQWVPTAGIASDTTASMLVLADTSATYVLTATLAGCPDVVDSFHLDVQPNPQVYIGNNRFVCKHDTLHLEATVTPAWYSHYIFSWSPGADLDDSTVPYVVFTPGDSTKMVLTVKTPAGCIAKDSVLLMVHPNDFANLDTTFQVCPHDSVRLMPVSTDAGVIYTWHPSQYLSDSTSAAPWVYPITTRAYWAVAINQFGCKDTVNALVVVSPAGKIDVGDGVTIYPGGSYQIPMQTNCTSFTWFPPAGLSADNIANPVATPLISTKYIVTGATEWGCIARDSINVNVSDESLLAVPNAFAPGNGPNSLFKILKNGIATLTYFRIYNRWGNMVYESTDIDAGWDGTYKGTPQPYDVYVYEIKALTSIGTPFEKHGNVTLIR